MGHFVKGLSFALDGNFPSAIEDFKKAIKTAQDPFYSQFSRYLLGAGYAQNGQFQEAEAALQEVASYSRDFGCEVLGTSTHALLGLFSIAQGRMGHGLNMMEEALQACLENQRRYSYARIEHSLGQVYLQIVEKSATVSLTTMVKNVGFILKNVPSAAKKAVEHFNKALEVAEEIGAKSIQGQVYVGLGRLHKAKGSSDQAQDCFSKAARIFRECEAKVYQKQANEALESLL